MIWGFPISVLVCLILFVLAVAWGIWGVLRK